MAATRNDMYWLSQDPGFMHRVQMSLVDRCFVEGLAWLVRIRLNLRDRNLDA